MRRAGTAVGLVAVAAAMVVVTAPAPVAADGNEVPSAPLAAGSITAGVLHACAIRHGAAVACWGENESGQLGQGTTTDVGDEPDEVADLPWVDLGPSRTAVALSAGGTHTCALLDDATVKCWGDNGFGQLGQGSTDTIGDQPGEVTSLGPVGLGEGRTATAISAGNFHSCALLDDATVKCWGDNGFGQLGQGSSDTIGDQPGEVDGMSPVALGSGATALAAGGSHTCALLDDGSVTCWGANEAGQLGRGDTVALGDDPGEMGLLAAVDLGAGRTATAVTAGFSHTCALLDDSSVKCWGANVEGQLGQDDDDQIGDDPGEIGALPPIDLGDGRTAVGVAAGALHTCALLDDATVKCWGGNAFGALGQGTNASRLGDGPGEMSGLAPVDLGTGRTATAITAGRETTCALLDDDAVKCWGRNDRGQLGQGSTDPIGDDSAEMATLEPIDFASPPAATITIELDALPADGRDFAFDAVGAGVADFVLDQDSDPAHPASVTFTGLDTAVLYEITQARPPGWSLTTIDCGGNPAVLFNTTDRRALIGVTSDDVTCRFVNRRHRPDLHVAAPTGAFVGNSVYATTPTPAQTRSARAPVGTMRTFRVRLQNDGSLDDRFRLRGVGSGAGGFTVKYFAGPLDVTSQVANGTFQLFSPLPPGSSFSSLLTVRITPTRTARVGTTRTVVLTLRPVDSTTPVDVARVRLTRS